MSALLAFLEARITEDERLARVGQLPRFVREAQAKRRLIEQAFVREEREDGEWGDNHSAAEIRSGVCKYSVVDDIPELRVLAAIYSTHPDYQQEWTP